MKETAMSPQQLKQQYEKEADELYKFILPDGSGGPQYYIAVQQTNDLQMAKREAYVIGRFRSSEELSKLQGELKEAIEEVEKWRNEALALRKENEWIKVSEQLPEFDTTILVWDSIEETIKPKIYTGGFADCYTHWRKRPSPPQH